MLYYPRICVTFPTDLPHACGERQAHGPSRCVHGEFDMMHSLLLMFRPARWLVLIITIMYRRKPCKAAGGRYVYSVYGTQEAGFHLALDASYTSGAAGNQCARVLFPFLQS